MDSQRQGPPWSHTNLREVLTRPLEQRAEVAAKISSPDGKSQDSTTGAPLRGKDGGGIPGPRLIREVIDEMKAGAGLEVNWLLENYVPCGGLVLLVGSPKAGKTTLAAHLAVKVALGVDFMGLTTRATPVLWLGLEERDQDVARRFDALKGYEAPIRYQRGPLCANESTLSDIKAWVKAFDIGLIVIDTLSKFLGVEDENDAAGVERAMRGVLSLTRDTGAAVLLLHHTRKSPGVEGSDVRGSSAILANVDVSLTLRTTKDGGSGHRVIEAIGRYQETPPKLEIELAADGYQALGAPFRVKARAEEEALLAVLSTDPQDAGAIAQKGGLPESTARRRLDRLAQHNPSQVAVSGSGKKNDPRRYSKPGQMPLEIPPPQISFSGGGMAESKTAQPEPPFYYASAEGRKLAEEAQRRES